MVSYVAFDLTASDEMTELTRLNFLYRTFQNKKTNFLQRSASKRHKSILRRTFQRILTFNLLCFYDKERKEKKKSSSTVLGLRSVLTFNYYE